MRISSEVACKAVVLFVAAVVLCGCDEDRRTGEPVATVKPSTPITEPEATPPPAEKTPATPEPSAAIESAPDRRGIAIEELDVLQEGWIRIEEKDKLAKRAWVEGYLANESKLVIDTDNVKQFRLDLSKVKLNWQKRVVFRLDGYNSELTKNSWPVAHFVRSPAGAWELVDPT